MTKIMLAQPFVEAKGSLGIIKPPTGIQYLGAVLKSLGYNVLLVHDSVDNIVAATEDYNPDYVGLSCMSNSFPEAETVAERINAPTILGGWHASGSVDSYVGGVETETLDEILDTFDFVVRGEGEVALPKLLEALKARQTPVDISGIGFKENGKIKLNPKQAERLDLNQIPTPLWTGLNAGVYLDLRTGKLDLSVHFNRGCRYRCSFCETAGAYEGRVRRPDAKKAVDYIESILRIYQPDAVTFTDEDLFSNIRWVREVVSEIKGRNIPETYKVSFDTFATINDLRKLDQDQALLEQMAESGFFSFTIGVESLNPETIHEYNKEFMVVGLMNTEEKRTYRILSPQDKQRMLVDVYQREIQKGVNLAYKHGILCCGDYIVGNPRESSDKVKEGFERFKQIDDLVIAYVPIYTPFPGTGLWKIDYDSGKIIRKPDGRIDWSRFDASQGALELDYDIQQLRGDMEVDFYTSARFQRDMSVMLKDKPGMLPFFEGRFKFMAERNPDDSDIKNIQERLRKY